MRLAAKLILLFLAGILLIVGIFAYLTIQLDRQLAIAQHQQRAKALAEAVQSDPNLRTDRVNSPTHGIGEPNPSVRFYSSQIRIVQFGTANDQLRPSVPTEMVMTREEITTISLPDETGQQRFYTYVPMPSVDEDGHADRRIEVSDPDLEADHRVRRSIISSLVAFIGVTFLSGMIIVIGGFRMVGEPLQKLTDKVRRIGQGDFTQPLELESNDELQNLARSINEMCDQLTKQRDAIALETASRLEAVEQLRHSDRLTSVGQMAAGFAHEIGTPLNVVAGRAELIAGGGLSADGVQDSAKAIQTESQRITKIVRSLLDFSRPRTPNRTKTCLNDLIQHTLERMKPLADNLNVSLQTQVPTQMIDADIDTGQLEQVLTNLMINAIHSIKTDGAVSLNLDVAKVSLDDQNQTPKYCTIEVVDNGQGIRQSEIGHVFEPFYTTKDVGEGTGLGLSIAHAIVKEHDGWIEVKSIVGKGSVFRVFLPLHEENAQ
ncbi:HAMP domain-containing histidine kinase [bacterium]|nr:HAMP domain-containing histidine kinase [bacterium]